MRKLIWIPLVHTHEEIVRFNPDAREEIELEARKAEIWGKIQDAVDNLDADFSGVKLFIENIGREEDIISEDWGPTSRMVRSLVARGAKIIPVDSELTYYPRRANFDKIIAMLTLQRQAVEMGIQYMHYDVLHKLYTREEKYKAQEDQNMADTISKSLHSSETGLLLTSYAHDVEQYLRKSKDIEFIPISNAVVIMFDKLTEDYPDMKYSSEYFRELRDSFAPQGRGPERQ